MKKIILSLTIILSFFIMLEVEADFTYTKGLIKPGQNAYLLSSPSSNASRVKSHINGDIYLPNPESFQILEKSGNFYKISIQYGGYYYTGYIPIGIVVKTDYLVKDSTP